MANNSRSSRLLELPAELRNNIYRLVLVEGHITTPPQGPLPIMPGLLTTNKQIRIEAMSIYLQENRFVFDIDDFNACYMTRFCSAILVKRQTVSIGAAMSEPLAKSWANLKTWLHAFYQERSHRGVASDARPGFERCHASQQLFDVAERFRDMEPMPIWEGVIEPMLENMRVALAAVDSSGVWT